MLEKIPFGRTGHESTRIIFGAAAFYELPQHDADKTLDLILEHGINHIDTAAGYNESEERIGPWLKHHRDKWPPRVTSEPTTAPRKNYIGLLNDFKRIMSTSGRCIA